VTPVPARLAEEWAGRIVVRKIDFDEFEGIWETVQLPRQASVRRGRIARLACRAHRRLAAALGGDEFAASSFVKIVAISSIVRLRSLGTASTAMEPAAI
jgi:hypothetical protein